MLGEVVVRVLGVVVVVLRKQVAGVDTAVVIMAVAVVVVAMVVVHLFQPP